MHVCVLLGGILCFPNSRLVNPQCKLAVYFDIAAMGFADAAWC